MTTLTRAPQLRRWLLAINRKDIGTLYMLFAFAIFLSGGAMALMLQGELFEPGCRLDGPITAQCLEGEVAFGMRHEHRLLRTGELIYLAARTPHELTATTDASLLVTVVLTSPTDASAIAGERRKHHDDDLSMKQTEDE